MGKVLYINSDNTMRKAFFEFGQPAAYDMANFVKSNIRGMITGTEFRQNAIRWLANLWEAYKILGRGGDKGNDPVRIEAANKDDMLQFLKDMRQVNEILMFFLKMPNDMITFMIIVYSQEFWKAMSECSDTLMSYYDKSRISNQNQNIQVSLGDLDKSDYRKIMFAKDDKRTLAAILSDLNLVSTSDPNVFIYERPVTQISGQQLPAPAPAKVNSLIKEVEKSYNDSLKNPEALQDLPRPVSQELTAALPKFDIPQTSQTSEPQQTRQPQYQQEQREQSNEQRDRGGSISPFGNNFPRSGPDSGEDQEIGRGSSGGINTSSRDEDDESDLVPGAGDGDVERIINRATTLTGTPAEKIDKDILAIKNDLYNMQTSAQRLSEALESLRQQLKAYTFKSISFINVDNFNGITHKFPIKAGNSPDLRIFKSDVPFRNIEAAELELAKAINENPKRVITYLGLPLDRPFPNVDGIEDDKLDNILQTILRNSGNSILNKFGWETNNLDLMKMNQINQIKEVFNQLSEFFISYLRMSDSDRARAYADLGGNDQYSPSQSSPNDRGGGNFNQNNQNNQNSSVNLNIDRNRVDEAREIIKVWYEQIQKGGYLQDIDKCSLSISSSRAATEIPAVQGKYNISLAEVILNVNKGLNDVFDVIRQYPNPSKFYDILSVITKADDRALWKNINNIKNAVQSGLDSVNTVSSIIDTERRFLLELSSLDKMDENSRSKVLSFFNKGTDSNRSLDEGIYSYLNFRGIKYSYFFKIGQTIQAIKSIYSPSIDYNFYKIKLLALYNAYKMYYEDMMI